MLFILPKDISKSNIMGLCSALEEEFPETTWNPLRRFEGGLEQHCADRQIADIRFNKLSRPWLWPHVNENCATEWQTSQDVALTGNGCYYHLNQGHTKISASKMARIKNVLRDHGFLFVRSMSNSLRRRLGTHKSAEK